MNPDHLKILQQGVAAWNAWIVEELSVKPGLPKPDLSGADLVGANLREARLVQADFSRAKLFKAKLSRAILNEATLFNADLREACLREAELIMAHLSKAKLIDANLRGALLNTANLNWADLSGADLRGAKLMGASLIEADIRGADLTGSHIYGISAWDLKFDENTKQQNLIITPSNEPEITVDNIEVAQFIYLMLHNEKIRDVVDTIGKKAVLILGRFTEERKKVLDALREELRRHDYLPILFDFDKPASKDLTGTVLTLAHMARFIIADLTDPSCIPYEVSKIADVFVPVRPILLSGKSEFAMFVDMQRRYHWVLPTHHYDTPEQLIADLKEQVIRPAEAKVLELQGPPSS
jgi:uncharacterized protein YjbI with pentapeptide repeats